MIDALVFRRVRAIDPHAGLDAVVDVVVERGRITRVGRDAAHNVPESDRVRVFNGEGLWLLPGLIDLHAHVREPGYESKEDVTSALRAAAAGGFVDICAMPNTQPINDSKTITEFLVAKARAAGGTRLHPIGAITVGQEGERLTEMADLRDAGAVGLSDDGRCVTSSAVMRSALEYASMFDLPIIQHAEDHALTEGAQMHEGWVSTKLGLRGWPRVAEDVIVARDLMLAEYTNARYHLAHASTEGSVRLLHEAKSRGIRATAEVTPHHLLLTHENVLGYETACKVNPPLREAHDVDALRKALADGTIDCIATDHAPHGLLDKDCEFDRASPGMIGLEICLPLMMGLVNDGAFSLSRLIDSLTRAPARIVGLPPPEIRETAEANLILYDPQAEWTIEAAALRSKGKNTPFLGRAVRGRVLATIVTGRVIFEAEEQHAGSR